jgi:hypothetical protein
MHFGQAKTTKVLSGILPLLIPQSLFDGADRIECAVVFFYWNNKINCAHTAVWCDSHYPVRLLNTDINWRR